MDLEKICQSLPFIFKIDFFKIQILMDWMRHLVSEDLSSGTNILVTRHAVWKKDSSGTSFHFKGTDYLLKFFCSQCLITSKCLTKPPQIEKTTVYCSVIVVWNLKALDRQYPVQYPSEQKLVNRSF